MYYSHTRVIKLYSYEIFNYDIVKISIGTKLIIKLIIGFILSPRIEGLTKRLYYSN